MFEQRICSKRLTYGRCVIATRLNEPAIEREGLIEDRRYVDGERDTEGGRGPDVGKRG